MSVWALLLLSVASVLGYPSGAPDGACVHFTPRHPGGSIQATRSPFSIQPQLVKIAQGNSLLITISSPQGLPYEGFMIQARNPLAPTVPLGTFTQLPAESKTLNCAPGTSNTVTHVDKKKKTTLDFEWQPPTDYLGTVVFNGTILQDYSTYWVGVQSDGVQVVKRSALENSDGISAGISTTRKPKTTTLPPTPSPPPRVISHRDRKVTDGLIKDCETTKTCFGFPTDCIALGNCKAIVTAVVSTNICTFEMRAMASNYVSVGLSNDGIMGDDSVVDCVYSMSNPGAGIQMFSSWNNVGSNTLIDTPPEELGIKLIESSASEGDVYCKFERDLKTTIRDVEFDLINNKYYLLLAAGTLNNNKDSAIGYHDTGRDATAEAVNLGAGGTLGGASKLLLRLHAAFMVTAWIGAAGIGIVLARYFKQTWVGNKLWGKDQWFQWHRMFMILTWCLTIAGFVMIFVQLRGWSSENNPHAILGTVTTGLCFIQPFMAAFRPDPTAPKRWLFNWLHWFVGNSAHILSIVTIFFGTRLTKAELPIWTDWILVAYVAFHVAMHLLLSIFGCASEKQNAKRVSSFPMKEMHSSRSPLSTHERSLDAPLYNVRKSFLGIYITGIIVVVSVFIVLIVCAPIEDFFHKLQKLVTK